MSEETRKIIIIVWSVTVVSFIAFDVWMRQSSGTLSIVEGKIKTGEHAGRRGRVVSTPSIWNLYHRRMVLNVPATEQEIRERYQGQQYADQLVDQMRRGRGPRQWITEWSSNLELTEL